MFDGLETHSSGKFNGDRWSLVLFVHASWETVSDDIAKQLNELGLPCPPSATTPKPTQVAVPAPSDNATTALLPKGRASRRAGKRGANAAAPAPPNPPEPPDGETEEIGPTDDRGEEVVVQEEEEEEEEILMGRPKKP